MKATPESESHGGRRGGDWVKKVSLATLLTGGKVKVDNYSKDTSLLSSCQGGNRKLP